MQFSGKLNLGIPPFIGTSGRQHKKRKRWVAEWVLVHEVPIQHLAHCTNLLGLRLIYARGSEPQTRVIQGPTSTVSKTPTTYGQIHNCSAGARVREGLERTLHIHCLIHIAAGVAFSNVMLYLVVQSH